MDAVEFLKERNRLCNSFRYNCLNCPAYNCANSEHFEETVALIEKWSKEHPIITNEMKFEEVFGEIPQTLVQVSPADADVIILFGEW